MTSLAGRNSLYWDEFAMLLRRNAAPNAFLRFHAPIPTSPQDICTVVDGNLPQRNGYVDTGYRGIDWLRDSMVCNAGWDRGEIPMEDQASEMGIDLHTGQEVMVKRPIRGVKNTIKIMLDQGCLVPSREFDEILERDSRTLIQRDFFSHLTLLYRR